MATKSNVIEFPTPKWLQEAHEMADEFEAALDYYGRNPARRSSKHFEWWEHIVWSNQEHAKRYPKSFAHKLCKRYGDEKAGFWIDEYGLDAVIEIFSFHEFMEHIRG